MKFVQLFQTFTRLAADFLGLRSAAPATASTPIPATKTTQTSTSAVVIPLVPRAAHRPSVRVIRVSEPGMAAGSAGRMVMSGRFADVCAELDRMAA